MPEFVGRGIPTALTRAPTFVLQGIRLALLSSPMLEFLPSMLGMLEALQVCATDIVPLTPTAVPDGTCRSGDLAAPFMTMHTMMTSVATVTPLAMLQFRGPAASGRRRSWAGAQPCSYTTPPMRPCQAAVGGGGSGALWSCPLRRRPWPRGPWSSRRTLPWTMRPQPQLSGCRRRYHAAEAPFRGAVGHRGAEQLGGWWSGAAVGRGSSLATAVLVGLFTPWITLTPRPAAQSTHVE